MNLNRIYKAIDEGLKLSLIDFGNNKILKSSYVNNSLITIQDIDNWYESGEDMPENMYKELCKKKYIGFYIVKDNDQLNNIFYRIKFEHINLNWLDVSNLKDFMIKNHKNYKYSLDIRYWDINEIPCLAFYDCRSLTSINIPDSITRIVASAFNNCLSLNHILIPNSVISVDDGAFTNCTSLTTIIIPYKVKKIATSTFETCKSLTSIDLPNGITSIGENAFTNCTSLESILIPDSITDIDDYAFYNCSALTNILYNGTMEQWNRILFGLSVFEDINYIVHCLDGDIKING